jgi:hypothetical protein
MWQHATRMLGGPGHLRFMLQPAVAVALGVLHGLRDHRSGRPPVVLAIARARGHRLQQLGRELRAIALPLAIALAASLVFQYLVLSRVGVGYAVLYAILFVALPYFLARGGANRLAGTRRAPRHA